MNPQDPNQPQNLPGQQPPTGSSGSDWQRQAIEAARAGTPQPIQNIAAPVTPSAPGVPTQLQTPAVPDWQQGFVRHSPPTQAQSDVPDMLAAAESREPVRPPEVTDMFAALDPPQSKPAPQPLSPLPPAPGDSPTPPAPGMLISGSFGQDIPQGTPVTAESSSGRSKKLLLILVISFVVFALGVAAFFIFRPDSNKAEGDLSDFDAADTITKQIDLDTIQDATFTAPVDLTGYTEKTLTQSTSYLVKDGGNATYECRIAYGVYTAAQLPGKDDDEITQNAVAELKKSFPNVAVAEAVRLDPLILPDTNDPTTGYPLQAYRFGLSKDDSAVRGYMASAILKSGNRLSIAAGCSVDGSSTINQADMDALIEKSSEFSLSTVAP